MSHAFCWHLPGVTCENCAPVTLLSHHSSSPLYQHSISAGHATDAPWVLIDGATVECVRCKILMDIPLPCKVQTLTKILRSFIAVHAECEEQK